jgi:putative methyltransferase (TIGR04325 family)
MRVKDFIPPVLVSYLYNFRGLMGKAPWKYIKEGFSYQLKSAGWDMNEIALVQLEKWEAYKNYLLSTNPLAINHEGSMKSLSNDPFYHNLLNSFAHSLCLASINKKAVNFLDWGGGLGHYGVLAKSILSSTNLPLHYYCYDFEPFCKYGKQVNPEFTYESDKQHLIENNYDLILASSSIWYEKNWKDGIDTLSNFKTDYLYITRMIFVEHVDSFVALQQPENMGYKTEYLFWVINKKDFLEYVQSKGFQLIREFEFGEITPIYQAPENGTLKGFLFKKNN